MLEERAKHAAALQHVVPIPTDPNKTTLIIRLPTRYEYHQNSFDTIDTEPHSYQSNKIRPALYKPINQNINSDASRLHSRNFLTTHPPWDLSISALRNHNWATPAISASGPQAAGTARWCEAEAARYIEGSKHNKKSAAGELCSWWATLTQYEYDE